MIIRFFEKKKIVISFLLIGIILFVSGDVSYAHDNTNNSNRENNTIVFADCGWDSIRIHNAIAAFILEKGYGYNTDVITGSSPIAIRGLRQGDIDICMKLGLIM